MRQVSFSLVVLVSVLVIVNVPTTNSSRYGAWIRVNPQPLSASDQNLTYDNVNGLPPATCDHSAVDMGNGRILMGFGGDPGLGSYINMQNFWVLDTTANPPAWSLLNPSGILPDRSNFPLRAASEIQHSIKYNITFIFGGLGGLDINNQIFIDELGYLNHTSNTWTEIVPTSPDSVSNPGPINRAWTDCTFLNMDDRETAIFYGGEGTLDGNPSSVHAHDLDDLWMLSMKTMTWIGRRDSRCDQSMQVCGDMNGFLQAFPLLANLSQQFVGLGNSSSSRPNDYEAMASNLSTLASEMAVQIEASMQNYSQQNNDSTCTTSCSAFRIESEYLDGTTPIFNRSALQGDPPKPWRLEGSRMQCFEGKCYLFGGYQCNVAGVMNGHGPDCFKNTMFIINLNNQSNPANVTWQVLMPPADGSGNWPSPRAYHTMIRYQRQLWVFGGGYVDSAITPYYYNDFHVFDIDTLSWEPVTQYGVIPTKRWSHTTTVVSHTSNSIWLWGGCLEPITSYNDLYVFKIGLQVLPQNCFANGSGLVSAVAGMESTFTIYALNSTTSANGSLTWGNFFDWGVSLNLLGQVVGQVGCGVPDIRVLSVSDNGNGTYSVKYTPGPGFINPNDPTTAYVQIFVFLDTVLIPGSPFKVALTSGPVDPLKSTFISASYSVRGEWANVTIIAKDQYGNPVTNQDLSGEISVMLSPTMTTPDFYVIRQNLVNYTVYYRVPTSMPSYGLLVSLQNMTISNSTADSMGALIVTYDAPSVTSASASVFVALAIVSLAVHTALLLGVVYFRGSKAMRAGSPVFIALMLVGGIICICSVFLLSNVTNQSCRAFPFIMGIGFMLLLPSLYVKIWRIMKIFNLKKLQQKVHGTIILSAVPLGLIAIEVIFNGIWLAVDPMYSETQSTSPPIVLDYYVCDSQHFTVFAVISYIYKAVMLLYGAFLASMTRNAPGAFNESRLLAVTLYNSILFGILGVCLPAFAIPESNLSAIYAIKAFCIIFGVTFATAIITVPRLYYCIYPPPDGFFDQNITTKKSKASSKNAPNSPGLQPLQPHPSELSGRAAMSTMPSDAIGMVAVVPQNPSFVAGSTGGGGGGGDNTSAGVAFNFQIPTMEIPMMGATNSVGDVSGGSGFHPPASPKSAVSRTSGGSVSPLISSPPSAQT